MSEIIDALKQLEDEKGISKEEIMQAIEKSLVSACERDFGAGCIFECSINRDTADISVVRKKLVVETVEKELEQISLDQAKAIDAKYEIGDYVSFDIKSKEFGRIAAQKARSIIVQKIKEVERSTSFDYLKNKIDDIVMGYVQRIDLKNNDIYVNIEDKYEAVLSINEQVTELMTVAEYNKLDPKPRYVEVIEKTTRDKKTGKNIKVKWVRTLVENYKPGDRIKLYVVDVLNSSRSLRIVVSRTHPNLVKRLFEKEISEVADGTVEIKSISREAGSRTKIAVWSKDENVDPVGACVGLNGSRVSNIVDDLYGEKIDIIKWSENPADFIETSLSPSTVVSVDVDVDSKSAVVVVPHEKISLAIGKEGQNARLAARLTGYKIDIKDEANILASQKSDKIEE